MNKITKIALLVLVPFLLTGCFIKVSEAPIGSGGGIFASEDNGTTWGNISNLLSVEGQVNFQGAEIIKLLADPNNPAILYAGSIAQGIFYSVDSGRSWQQTLSEVDYIYDLAVSPDDSCTIFAAAGNVLYRSTDCARSWQSTLTESEDNATLVGVTIDPNDANLVLAISSVGTLYQSEDKGESWQVNHWFDQPLAGLYINPQAGRIIYVASKQNGVWRSLDRGANWINITSELAKQYKGVNNFHQLIINHNNAAQIYLVSDYGILVSNNGGDAWRSLSLLTPPNSVYIYAMTISPQDDDRLFYNTQDTFYTSNDGGDNWTTKRLPTTRTFSTLLASSQSENLLYAGTRKVK
ncbi:MAG: WD40/YVTN/BNR-like repeat-containing protein [Candidatus Komeilibacteria bacterium]